MFIKFILWIKSSFEGKYGTTSSRRLMAAHTMGLLTVGCIVYWIKISDAIHLLYLNIALMLFICVLTGIILIQNIVEIIRLVKNKPKINQNTDEVF